ncbi:hypothetical protein C1637_08440 [Chryseobacterium lactis]|uniref:Protein SirB1 N-terminal domain-containing protein n=2 Tax=Chryseobacterium lactis TaxID=1241981 RepID=A0A3G6RIP4_CHRLC|nr:hypothetical protein EG342_11255 [Chryseobacterium lactis]AZB02817.1 hypothetical protein EG341_02115 [Chryseobacterium lactis]PNW13889.1 hypothetical protein C1637_08440 [Chryseobacterium lactis]
MKYFYILLFISISSLLKSQENRFYDDAYLTIDNMLKDKQKYSFKTAVLSVENAYYQGKLDTVEVDRKIKFIANFCKTIVRNRDLTYKETDKETVSKYAAIFSVICEETPILINQDTVRYKPFSYDFQDVFGHKDLTSLFVSKLVTTQKGNCNSLPYLYKILAEELGVEANIALAPNHIYIKHNIKSIGWYNTELTSGIFPQDAWLMASGFIHLNAIENGVYMKALDNRESLALCLVDLANAYKRSFPDNDGTFAIKCAERALQVSPNLVTALLLKAETHKEQYQKLEKSDPKAKELLVLLNKEYSHIHQIGYRNMPEGMYLEWLVSLKTERKKYEDVRLRN